MRRHHPSEGRRAFTFVELAVVLGLFSLGTGFLWPKISDLMAATELRIATSEVAAAFYEARLYSLRHSTNVAVRFEAAGSAGAEEGAVSWSLFRDGDNDGVLKPDILAGIDPLVRGGRRLEHFGSRIRFGFPPGQAPTEIGDPGRRIPRLDDPLRFGNSGMASFSPLGKASPGTAYITDGKSQLMAIRIGNLSGKVTIWSYDPAIQRWRRQG